MPEIKIKVRDKCADGEGVIICNNSDYTVVWDLDGEWTPYDTKTMRVNLADGTYQDVVFTGDTATLPVLTASGWVSVGLYAGDIHTSRAARLLALSSVLTPGGSPAAPAEDVYAQIMAKLNELSTVSPEDIAKAVEDYLTEHPAASASMRVEGGYIQFSSDGKTWENVIALADLKGSPGSPGSPGKDGLTPHIGDNDNWYLGDTDTGKPSRGAPGAKGDPGKDGAGMDVTGATVGQTVKIAAVDGNGVPTAWEPVDMPSGSGEKAWILVADTVTEEGAVGAQWLRWNKDIAGNAFSYSELIVKVTPKYADNNSHDIIVSLENNKNYWLFDSVLQNDILGIMHFKIILSEGLGLVRGEWAKNPDHHGGSYATVNLWVASNSEFFIPVPTSVQIGLRDSPLAGTQIQVYVR
nr:MAG TPA: nucleoid-associated protein [Caudoviricetes sp.]